MMALLIAAFGAAAVSAGSAPVSDPPPIETPDPLTGLPVYEPTNIIDISGRDIVDYIVLDDQPTMIIAERVPTINIWALLFYFWPEIVTVVLAIIILCALRRLWKIRRNPGVPAGEPYCRKCHYQLTACESEKCPECGEKLTMRNRRIAKKRPSRFMPSCLTLILCVGVLATMVWKHYTDPIAYSLFDVGPGGIIWTNLPRHHSAIQRHQWGSTWLFDQFVESRSEFLSNITYATQWYQHRVSRIDLDTGHEDILVDRPHRFVTDAYDDEIDCQIFIAHGHLVVDDGQFLECFDLDTWQTVLLEELRVEPRGCFVASNYVEFPMLGPAPHMEAIVLIDFARKQATLWSLVSGEKHTFRFPSIPGGPVGVEFEVHDKEPKMAIIPFEGDEIIILDLKDHSVTIRYHEYDEYGWTIGPYTDPYFFFNSFPDADVESVFGMIRPNDGRRAAISNRLVVVYNNNRPGKYDVADGKQKLWVARLATSQHAEMIQPYGTTPGYLVFLDMFNELQIFDLHDLLEMYPVDEGSESVEVEPKVP